LFPFFFTPFQQWLWPCFPSTTDTHQRHRPDDNAVELDNSEIKSLQVHCRWCLRHSQQWRSSHQSNTHWTTHEKLCRIEARSAALWLPPGYSPFPRTLYLLDEQRLTVKRYMHLLYWVYLKIKLCKEQQQRQQLEMHCSNCIA
jgi:hypothetical protein